MLKLVSLYMFSLLELNKAFSFKRKEWDEGNDVYACLWVCKGFLW